MTTRSLLARVVAHLLVAVAALALAVATPGRVTTPTLVPAQALNLILRSSTKG